MFTFVSCICSDICQYVHANKRKISELSKSMFPIMSVQGGYFFQKPRSLPVIVLYYWWLRFLRPIAVFFARAEPARGFVRIRMVPRPVCARSLQDDRGGHLWMQGTDSDKKIRMDLCPSLPGLWRIPGSNWWPLACHASALANWANPPLWVQR